MIEDPASLSRRRLIVGAMTAVLLGAGAAGARAPDRSPRPVPRPGVRSVPAVVQPSAAPSLASAPLEQILRRANLGGELGFIAIDAQSGAIIEERNADTPLPPASVAKAPSALYAIHALGLEHRFSTRVLVRGDISGGTLSGDLVLQGGGDPNLQTADLAALADRIFESGLRRVNGRLLVDASALPQIDSIDASQLPQAGYSPALSGLNLNFNRVHFGWAVRGGTVTLQLDARSNRETPVVSSIAIATSERDFPTYTYDGTGPREEWRVARAALTGEGSRWLPVRRPAIYCGDVLRALLAARGCTLPAPRIAAAAAGDRVLADHRSAPLAGMMQEMLRFSTNITAECAGLSASLRSAQAAGTLAASGAAMSRWLAGRYGAAGLSFVDHSGLGDRSRVSARAMGAFFLAAHRAGILAPILRPQPMRDSEGREMANHPLAVFAKTGTLNFASALGGYATPRQGGRTVAFAIFAADLNRRAAIPETERERPPGAQPWSRRARRLQQDLIERWSML